MILSSLKFGGGGGGGGGGERDNGLPEGVGVGGGVTCMHKVKA